MAANTYDPALDPEYQKYLAQLQAAQAQKPGYQSQYTGQVQNLYQQLMDRQPFRYDINTDALYDQYRRSYTRQGKLAMEDTMARAQAMTGGYGSSYAQTAGQQAYQGYLGKLSDAIPELYRQALEQYQAQGTALMQRYELASGAESQDYQRHKNALDAYHRDLAQIQSQADQAYNRGFQQNQDAWQRRKYAYDNLVLLIRRGYRPTEEELREAGMTQAQANAWR